VQPRAGQFQDCRHFLAPTSGDGPSTTSALRRSGRWLAGWRLETRRAPGWRAFQGPPTGHPPASAQAASCRREL